MITETFVTRLAERCPAQRMKSWQSGHETGLSIMKWHQKLIGNKIPLIWGNFFFWVWLRVDHLDTGVIYYISCHFLLTICLLFWDLIKFSLKIVLMLYVLSFSAQTIFHSFSFYLIVLQDYFYWRFMWRVLNRIVYWPLFRHWTGTIPMHSFLCNCHLHFVDQAWICKGFCDL